MITKNLTPVMALSLMLFTSCSSALKFSNSLVSFTGKEKQETGNAFINEAASVNYLAGSQLNVARAKTIKPEIKVALPLKSEISQKTDNKIIEKGGRYVYIPASFMLKQPETGTETWSAKALQQKTKELKEFAAKNNCNTNVAFFIDMSVKSGRNRFMVVNLHNNAIIKTALAAHGKGEERFTFDKRFSNDEGSNCTSLGMYKIGKAYNGAFGLSYKLYGLDKTNSNAFKRYVVLHAMGSIPNEETKWPITQTEGCPAVSPAFLEELAPVLDKAQKSILLYIYNGEEKEMAH